MKLFPKVGLALLPLVSALAADPGGGLDLPWLLRPAVDQADPDLIRVVGVQPRLQGLALDAPFPLADEEDIGVLGRLAGGDEVAPHVGQHALGRQE